jgi:hypothetical protein
MKRLAVSVCVLLILISSTRSSPFVDNTAPDEIVRQFYGWYIGRLAKDDFKPLKNRTVTLKYLTAQFLARVPRLIKETDADPIICAQDFDPTWTKNLKIGTPTIKGSQATTDLQLVGEQQMQVKLKITLKLTTAGWRIDKVDCGY